MKYIKYLRYLIIHKFWVFIYCCQYGLYWRGIIHDLSKFLPSEFIPYANYFYNKPQNKNCYNCCHQILGSQCDLDGAGIGDGTVAETMNCKDFDKTDSNFDYAWLLHQKRNPHHWQYWILINDNGNIRSIQIPNKYILEMVADWRGAGKAINGKDNTYEWYLKNKDIIILNQISRDNIELLLKE